MKLSSGYKAEIAPLFKSVFDGGKIRVFSGGAPTSADLEETGVLLGEINLVGGLYYDISGGYIVKPPAAEWKLRAIADGNMGWARICPPGYENSASYVEPRIDIEISNIPSSGAEMIVKNLAVLSGVDYSIDTFYYTL